MFKLLIIVLLLAILLSLAVALFNLLQGGGDASGKTVKALTVRVGISVGLFILLMIAAYFGWIQPHGL